MCMLLDFVLCVIGIDLECIDGYVLVEFMYFVIVVFVVSGMVDFGFGVELVVCYFGLDFILVVDEDYYFVCECVWFDVWLFVDVLVLLCDVWFVEWVVYFDGYDLVVCGVLECIVIGLVGSDGVSVFDGNFW